MLRLGLVVADSVFALIRASPEPVPVRCVISANDSCVVFRFHQIRPGDEWIDGTLRSDPEMVVVADRHP
ncbi:hypothetical protein GCM10009733_019280 [Nonomuraea maheshkhaliensis]|uniref:Uncharacterized protein n=1 Tax=Nonomuraea maheshkhaliensis TaxID=419590 RepID=A0ABN2F0Y8_9ACTN